MFEKKCLAASNTPQHAGTSPAGIPAVSVLTRLELFLGWCLSSIPWEAWKQTNEIVLHDPFLNRERYVLRLLGSALPLVTGRKIQWIPQSVGVCIFIYFCSPAFFGRIQEPPGCAGEGSLWYWRLVSWWCREWCRELWCLCFCGEEVVWGGRWDLACWAGLTRCVGIPLLPRSR